jgi:hypothetical protein
MCPCNIQALKLVSDADNARMACAPTLAKHALTRASCNCCASASVPFSYGPKKHQDQAESLHYRYSMRRHYGRVCLTSTDLLPGNNSRTSTGPYVERHVYGMVCDFSVNCGTSCAFQFSGLPATLFMSLVRDPSR